MEGLRRCTEETHRRELRGTFFLLSKLEDYGIEIIDGDTRWSVRKRYREFRDLHDHVRFRTMIDSYFK